MDEYVSPELERELQEMVDLIEQVKQEKLENEMIKHNQNILTTEILKMSQSQNWNEAIKEWKLESISYSDHPTSCLCGHKPIKNLCYLRNNVNNNTALVGSICVNKFMGQNTEKIFTSLANMKDDYSNGISIELADYARMKDYINDWEHSFIVDTRLKRSLSGRQEYHRMRINKHITECFVRDVK